MAALLLLVAAAAAAARVGELARRDAGDVFTIISEDCGPAQCSEHGAGASAEGAPCACTCPQRAPLFREDRELCVDDLPECSLATFGTGVGVQRIPFVYLPLKGQIIHPSKEITFQNVKTPICAVSGAQFLTRKGFLDLRNTLDADVPFNLFRDEGRTFLQWSGEDEVRARMSGRVMVVRLLCRDVDATPTSPMDLRGVFTPCVAFRVQGTPPKHSSNMTEVQFALNAQTSAATNNSGLTVTEYVAIGISSLLLGLIYVASVFLYLHIRKRRKTESEEDKKRMKGLKKKDGTAITERDIVRIKNERIPSLPNSIGQDEGIVKKNPLLSMRQQFHDGKSSFNSDSASNMSDSEDFGDGSLRSENNMQRQTISAIVHPRGEIKMQNDASETSHRDESSIERLPDEHVSIVETTDDREIARPVGTTRRKLYFNPAYFEPHLMAEPPPAALEFLTKIREVISIAKHKMAAKRFHPVLNQIPEEETYPSTRNSIDLYQGLGSQRSGSIVSLKRENSRKRSVNCVGCPGCKSDTGVEIQNYIKYDIPACANCLKSTGDKQNSIRQWLENIPSVKQQTFYNDFLPSSNQSSMVNSLLSLPVSDNRNKVRKQNSFSGTNHMHPLETRSRPKKSTMSVRSEPIVTKHYNLPLPEFKNTDSKLNNYEGFCQTVSKVDDISPVGFNDNRPGSLRGNAIENHRRNKFITNKNALPDMVNEAIALEHCSKSFNLSSSDEEKYNKVINAIYGRNQSESPPVHDYETDSLERTSNKKGISTPTEYPEVPSSQASPSLSNALPLEEELTMRNAVYKHSSSNSNTPSPQRDIFIDQNHYETIERQENINKSECNVDSKAKNYSLVSEVYVNNNFGSPPSSPNGSESSLGSRKLIPNVNNDAVPGCLTIEVKDSPENYIKIHESDDFEPDTLDRKHLKHREIVASTQFSRRDLIRNITNSEHQPSQRILLRSSGTFTKTNDKVEYATKFNSLRNDFELCKNNYGRPKLSPTMFSRSKSLDDNADDGWEDVGDWTTEDGRILTLELRHSKRQRQSTPPTIKQIKSLARPDILPPLPPTEECPIYEQPAFPPRKVENHNVLPIENETKNLSGRSLSPRTSTKDTVEFKRRKSVSRERHHGPSCSPMGASVDSMSSEYENITPVKAFRDHQKSGDICRNSNMRPSLRSNCSNDKINTSTCVRDQKLENVSKRKRRKGSFIEDSGYLSSDSTSSRQMQRKLVVAKIVSCSDSDDTENEARSESGAESIETHSVYFGSFRKLQAAENNNFKSARDSRRKRNGEKNF